MGGKIGGKWVENERKIKGKMSGKAREKRGKTRGKGGDVNECE
jgi:hypothetical protein